MPDKDIEALETEISHSHAAFRKNPAGVAKTRLHSIHGRIPLLKRLPPRAVSIIVVLLVINCAVWIAVGIVLHLHPGLAGSAILAYTFGLRHALDADHISAIDLMTRRLVAAKQRPVTVGTWFSLGHSTIVVVTSIVVAAAASSISKRFNSFSYIGGIIGSSVSATFLLLLGGFNAYILCVLVKQLRKHLAVEPENRQQEAFKIQGGGCLFYLLKKLFKLVDRPWKMYPIGVLFGLGFDTSSEIALLGIASIRAAQGTSLWLILIFPILFTAGMCLLDTLDGALMMALYTNFAGGQDNIAVLYYNIVLTGLTVVVAIVIGTIQFLGLGQSILGDSPKASGKFWEGITRLQDSWDIVGAGICGLFIVVGLGSVLLYKPWRRWVDKQYDMGDVEETGRELEEIERPYELDDLQQPDMELGGAETSKLGIDVLKGATASEMEITSC